MKKLILALVAICSQVAWGDAVVFTSRNMPSTCEYVFTVESDLKVELPQSFKDEEVTYKLQNSWAPFNWTEEETLPLEQTQKGRFVEWTFVSMSIPGKYLYRNVLLTFPQSRIKCQSEFGRQFGEACMRGGRNETPWRTRQLICQPF